MVSKPILSSRPSRTLFTTKDSVHFQFAPGSNRSSKYACSELLYGQVHSISNVTD
ncbi:unnamed protein product, partial [Mycena citricolor]